MGHSKLNVTYVWNENKEENQEVGFQGVITVHRSPNSQLSGNLLSLLIWHQSSLSQRVRMAPDLSFHLSGAGLTYLELGTTL